MVLIDFIDDFSINKSHFVRQSDMIGVSWAKVVDILRLASSWTKNYCVLKIFLRRILLDGAKSHYEIPIFDGLPVLT